LVAALDGPDPNTWIPWPPRECSSYLSRLNQSTSRQMMTNWSQGRTEIKSWALKP
jgi:hypothetical protein